MSAETLTDCRLGAKLTLEQCERRQVNQKRCNVNGVIDPAFCSCKLCQHWLNDEEYKLKVGATAGRWILCRKVRNSKKGGVKDVTGISDDTTAVDCGRTTQEEDV